MADKNNAVCKICGKPYYACMSCADSMKLKPWQTYCCSSNCYKVFQVVRGFSTGVYTKEEFKSKLQNIDLSDLENYREHIKDIIKDALKENKEELVIDEILKVASTSRKRNHKVDNEFEKTE